MLKKPHKYVYTRDVNVSLTKQEKSLKFLFLFIVVFFILWWFALHSSESISEGSGLLDIFSDTYGLVALFGSAIGFIASSKWGGTKSKLGLGLTLLSTGLLFQFLGQLSYGYYRVVLGIDNPYPSFGEIFYFGSIPIYIWGTWMLALSSGIKVALRNLTTWIGGFIIVLAMLSLDYFLFIKDYNPEGVEAIAVFLDYAYPIFQAILVSLAIFTFFLSRQIWEGKVRICVLMLIFSLYAQYLADTMYTYRIYQETWFAGDYTDLLYIISYALLGITFLKFNSVHSSLINGGSKQQVG